MRKEKPRLRALSGLKALWHMRNRPVGVAEGTDGPLDIGGIGTTWSIIPANDNTPQASGSDTEMALEVLPSINDIMRQVKRGPIEYGTHVDEKKKAHRVITRIGRLRFSDGSQVEKGHKLVAGEPAETNLKMPVGAMLGCREREAREKGQVEDIAYSNAHFRWMLGDPKAPRSKALTPKPGPRVEMTKAEAEKMLADAIANTPVMPPVTKCPDGLPFQPKNLRTLFIGGQKGKNGESGSQAWEDIFDQMGKRDTYAKAIDEMVTENVEVLTRALSARSLRQIGEARGYHGKYAIEAGRRLLIAANDDFNQAMSMAEAARA